MEILFVLLILLTIVTVVGHVIWLVLAAFVRALFVDDRVVAKKSQQRPDRRQQQLNNLAITENQISLFYSEGKLNEETFEQVMERIRAERASLVHSASQRPAQFQSRLRSGRC